MNQSTVVWCSMLFIVTAGGCVHESEASSVYKIRFSIWIPILVSFLGLAPGVILVIKKYIAKEKQGFLYHLGAFIFLLISVLISLPLFTTQAVIADKAFVYHYGLFGHKSMKISDLNEVVRIKDDVVNYNGPWWDRGKIRSRNVLSLTMSDGDIIQVPSDGEFGQAVRARLMLWHASLKSDSDD